jgi:trimethylamine:corrinoid methyltransferase-like protein
MIESGVTFDFGQLVMDNEIARMIKFAVAGIPVTDDSLAVDEIIGVGPLGDFLSLRTGRPWAGATWRVWPTRERSSWSSRTGLRRSIRT